MNLIGLTGGIGMGKSTAAQWLLGHGLPVVDTDQLARDVVEPGQPALVEILRAFGTDLAGPDGRLRRDELARRVFADADARRQLESITHPRIRAAWGERVAAWRAEKQPRGVVVIPLLYETEAAPLFDTIVCVACSAATQRERLRARGWTEEQLNQRIAAQWPVERKMALAHYVVWTEGDLEVHAGQLERILRRIG